MTYAPRPGSIGERSLRYLKDHGPKSLRDLADGIDADLGSMSASLSMCIQNGLLKRDVVDGEIVISLPKPSAVIESIMRPNGMDTGVSEASYERVDADHVVIVNDGAPLSVHRENRIDVNGQRYEKLTIESAQAAETETPTSIIEELAPSTPVPFSVPVVAKRIPRHFAVGVFSDGRFAIEVGDRGETLTRDETETLWKFVHGIERPFDEQA